MEESCKHKIIPRRIIEEEIEVLGERLLSDPPNRNQSTSK